MKGREGEMSSHDTPGNPFEDLEGTYLVLVNAQEQYSIWPDSLEVPVGWTVAHAAGPRADALAYVERVWTDLRPRSLREQRSGARLSTTAGEPS